MRIWAGEYQDEIKIAGGRSLRNILVTSSNDVSFESKADVG
jgi:hypothetical protein